MHIHTSFHYMANISIVVSYYSSWYIDNTTNITTVTYLLTGANSTLSYSDVLYRYSYEACPRSGCPSPPRPGGPIDAKLVIA